MVSSKGQMWKPPGLLRFRSGTNSVISTMFCWWKQVRVQSRFKGRELIMMWIQTYGLLGATKISIYLSSLCSLMFHFLPHAKYTHHLLRPPKISPHCSTRIGFEVIISSPKSSLRYDWDFSSYPLLDLTTFELKRQVTCSAQEQWGRERKIPKNIPVQKGGTDRP